MSERVEEMELEFILSEIAKNTLSWIFYIFIDTEYYELRDEQTYYSQRHRDSRTP